MKVVVQGDGGPRNAYTDADDRRWYNWNGQEVPSVTTLIAWAGQAKRLVQWQTGKVAEAAIDQLPELYEFMYGERRPRERLDDADRARIRRDKAIKQLKKSAAEARDLAGRRGTAIHHAAEMGLTPDTVSDYVDPQTAIVVPREDIAPKLRQYLGWLDDSGFVPLLRERQVWNLTQGYAGSFDILGSFPNTRGLWMVDIKTGTDCRPKDALQQEFYRNGEFIGEDGVIDHTASALLRRVEGCALLHLRDDSHPDGPGWSFHALESTAETHAAFLGVTAYVRWLRNNPDVTAFAAGTRKGVA